MKRGILDPVRRRALGAFYTPDGLARAIVDRAIGLLARGPRTVLDPACGDGAFLMAPLPDAVVTGVDVDPGALAAARERVGPGVELLRGDALDPGTLADRRFDLIVGNPPFGLRRDDARAWGLDVKRTDSYAAFLAMGLARLAPEGVLAFITADTWLSIRSHQALRELLLPFLHEVALLPPGAFDATVNTCLVVLKAAGNGGVVATSDLGRGRLGEGLGAGTEAGPTRYADVGQIKGLPGFTIFVGEPGLAEIVANGPSRQEEIAPGHVTQVRTITRHGRAVRLVRLGDIAASPHGISTGANDRYVRVLPGTRGSYREIEPGMLASAEILAAVTDHEREHGLEYGPDSHREHGLGHGSDSHRERGLAGGPDSHWERGLGCYVPFDKGGEAAAADGWLPNYHVPTPYFVNWAAGALADMRRNKGFAWKNWRYFFRPGLTFSVSGIYAPTFRLGAGGVFEAKSSGLFCEALPPELLLGILCSRPARYLFKVFIKHSVDTSGADIARFPLVLPAPADAARIAALAAGIISQQRRDPHYPYHRREQVELDALVARCYGLSGAEVDAVDGWFAGRYPRLAAALGLGPGPGPGPGSGPTIR